MVVILEWHQFEVSLLHTLLLILTIIIINNIFSTSFKFCPMFVTSVKSLCIVHLCCRFLDLNHVCLSACTKRTEINNLKKHYFRDKTYKVTFKYKVAKTSQCYKKISNSQISWIYKHLLSIYLRISIYIYI